MSLRLTVDRGFKALGNLLQNSVFTAVCALSSSDKHGGCRYYSTEDLFLKSSSIRMSCINGSRGRFIIEILAFDKNS